MPHITFIHGMGNKPSAERLGILWKRAIERDEPRPADIPGSNPGIRFGTVTDLTWKLVYWADVFYAEPDADESGYEGAGPERNFEGIPAEKAAAAEPLAVELGSFLPEAEAIAIERIASQLGLGTQPGEDHIPTDQEVARASAGEYALERVPLPWWAKERLLKLLLRDVHHYLFNTESKPRPGVGFKSRDELRNRLLNGLKEGAVGSGPHVLIAHSMGSIIAYDVLRNMLDCPPIDHLLTIGSPLGLDEVQDKLKPERAERVDFPKALRGEWVNVYDRLDPVVGFDPIFTNDFKRDGLDVITDMSQENWGRWRHSIHKYLAGQAVRHTLRRWLGVS